MTHCPCCGYSLEQDKVIERDGFMLDPRGPVAFDGAPVPISKQQSEILFAIAAEEGRLARHAMLAERIGYEGDLNSVVVQVSKMRRRLEQHRIPNPIYTVDGFGGYAWGRPA